LPHIHRGHRSRSGTSTSGGSMNTTEIPTDTTTTRTTTKPMGSWDYLMSMPFNVVQTAQEKAFIHELAKELYRKDPEHWAWDINDVLNTCLALNLQVNQQPPCFENVRDFLARVLPEKRFLTFGIWEFKRVCGIAFTARPQKRYAKKYRALMEAEKGAAP
jgi:hypothetical protein